MKDRTRFTVIAIILTSVLSLFIFGPANAEEMKHEHGKSAVMDLHHMHTMMNHGLQMAAEGSTLMMLAGMKMTPSLDPVMLEHGRQMLAGGKELVEHAMGGHAMKGLHKAGHGDDPLMKYTHKLGDAIMKVINMLDSMNMEGDISGEMMTMHHMHILINHALGMAAEGANMSMLGQMGMAKDVDKDSVEHGKMMMSDALKLLAEVMDSRAMKEMHEKGIKMNNAMMAETHRLDAAAKDVVDLLSGMPACCSK
ncbi:MAG: hypothetical protein HQL08_11275 [Nitrospirae bacterium]|nr:hypothetical protein [Nitrospirota bacterium]